MPPPAHSPSPFHAQVGRCAAQVTTDATDKVTQVEAINDVSSAFLYKGIYHIFHQCCQNHWDHVVSKVCLLLRHPPTAAASEPRR